MAAFAAEHGLPVAIKAAFGGGGRGLKVVHEAGQDRRGMYESAVREAVAAFGRGECFVERYLERPRHVETQCLADQHGAVVVVSTRDCSLQRRHQKLVEEAPAPFLTDAQQARLYEASKAILREAGYAGAGTCEFLVGQDGTVSFLEVNTRLQVEHPVSEEVTGLDLVREMFRIADGQRLGFGDPQVRGHSIEFRINAEDAGRNFLPAPGTITRWRAPSGPGVRVDAGYTAGMTVPQAFDSLLAKLIVTGATRVQALERSRRALDEFDVGGMPTVLPFHRAVVRDKGLHRGAVLGAHPVDRDRVRHADPAVRAPEADSAAGDGAGPGAGGAGERERIVVEVARQAPRGGAAASGGWRRGGRGWRRQGRGWPRGTARAPAAVRPVTGRRGRQ